MVHLTHTAEMSLGGMMEVCEKNIPLFVALPVHIIVVNPPWSALYLPPVLTTLIAVADQKDIPFLFLLPSFATKTKSFVSIMSGKRLVKWILPRLAFHGNRKVLGGDECAWYAYNWKLPADYFTFQVLGQKF